MTEYQNTAKNLQNTQRDIMWKYIKSCKSGNLKIVGLIMGKDLILLTSAFATMALTRAVLDGNFRNVVFWCLVSAGIYFLLNGVIFPAQDVLQGKVIAQMNQEMRREISKFLVNKSFPDYTKGDSGEYLSWYTNDVREAEEQGYQTFYSSVEYILQLILYGTALIFIRVELLLCTLLVSVLVLFFSSKLSAGTEDASKKVSKAMEEFTQAVKEQLFGFSVLKYFGHMDDFKKHLDQAGVELENERCQFVKKKEESALVLKWLNNIGSFVNNAVLFGMCALRIIPTEIFFGGGNLTGGVKAALVGLTENKVILDGARPYFDKFHYLEKKDSRKKPLEQIREEISIEHLAFQYADTPVLKDIDVSFKIGGKYAVIGKSGCGKSTLLKLLFGQLSGYQGKILYDGEEAGGFDLDTFYRQMAYIGQDVFLYDRTIRQNITLDEPFGEEEIRLALKQSALEKDLPSFPNGLNTMTGENGNLLSGGQKQRIAVARALIHHRKILLIDEGTSALDRENAAEIEDVLLAAEDLTVILVSHHLTEEKAEKYTAVYEMEDGCIRRRLCGNI